jgi:N-acylglucosamine 2-epimerase
LPDLGRFLERHLLEFVIPFWLRHGIDEQHGGLFTCIRDDGVILDRKKYMWSQCRALWTFSALYRRISPDPKCLEIAHRLFDFLKRYGRDREGRWVFITEEDGRVVEGENSIVTDAFAIFGLVEYWRITGCHEALSIALETHASVRRRIDFPGTYKTAPYPTPPGMKAHREYMQFSLAFHELGTCAGDAVIRDDGLRRGREVLDHFFRSERGVLLEYLGLDNRPQDSREGRAMVPGHGLESAYFQILLFSESGDDAYVRKACRAIRCCIEKGWDPVYGGIFLGIDADGQEPVYWKHHEKKIWWPHAEGLAALLIAFEHCGESWCLEWYHRLHEWTFRHFPVADHGEWTQRLDREGNPISDLIALPVKDPFHLPRGLIMAIESIRRMGEKP